MMAPQAWSQAGAPSGAGSSQKATEPSPSGTQRGTSGAPSDEMKTQRGAAPSGRAATARMSKDKVKEVQAALKSKGVDPGPEDGVLGPKTQQAIREFQKSNNLSVTGRIDDKTASALGVDVSAAAGTGTAPSGGMGAGPEKETSKGVGKSGSAAPEPGARGGTTASPPSKPAGKD